MDDRPQMTADRLLSAMIAWRVELNIISQYQAVDELLIHATMVTRDLDEAAAVQWLGDELEERRAAMAD